MARFTIHIALYISLLLISALSTVAADSLNVILYCTPILNNSELNPADFIDIYDAEDDTTLLGTLEYYEPGWGSETIRTDTSTIINASGGIYPELTFQIRNIEGNCLTNKVKYTYTDSTIGEEDFRYITSLIAENHIVNLPRPQACSESDPIVITSDIPNNNFHVVSEPSGLYIDPTGHIIPRSSKINEYTLSYQSNFCLNDYSTTFNILEEPQISFNLIDECDRVIVETNLPENSASFEWNDGSNKKSITISENSNIKLRVTSTNGCSSEDSIDIVVRKLNFLKAEYEKKEADCWQDGSIMVESFDIQNLIGAHNFQLKNTITNQAYSEMDMIPEGIYRLKVTDDRNCSAEYEQEVKVLQRCLENYPVFTPDGDDIEDNYFIPHDGEVNIFNREGVLVRKLITPAYWDGKDDAGNILPMGNYLMITNTDRKVNITIIR